MVDSSVAAQHWQSPPTPIQQILDAPPAPDLFFSPNQQWMVALGYQQMLPVAALAEPEVAIAGFRLNPKTFGPSRDNPYRSLSVRRFQSTAADSANELFLPIALPEDARIEFIRWSPDGNQLALTLTQTDGLSLAVVDLNERVLRPLLGPVLNATYGVPHRWLSNESLLCKVVPADHGAPPVDSAVPAGPLIQENLGRKTPGRTFTNLLKTPHDEALFEYYVTSELVEVSLTGECRRLVAPALIDEAYPSPDGQYILLLTLHRPYSFDFPAAYFPKRIEVLDRDGNLIHQVADLPLADNLSIKFDAARPGPRRVAWRSDRPATLSWVEALDDGDPTIEVPHRDALLELDAPFTATPQVLWKSEYRFRDIAWGRDDVALVWERWHDTRQSRLWRIYPGRPMVSPQLLLERSYEDRYTDPGMPLEHRGEYGHLVLRFTPDGTGVYFVGRGASPQGVHPFLDRWNLQTGNRDRLWQCQDPYFESILNVLDDDAQTLLTVRQSQTEPPNYWVRSRQAPQQQLTFNPDPAPDFAGIHKEVVQYQRGDGVELSATLYLPPGYDAERDGPLPTLLWVYPEEFKDRKFAGQVTTAENTFSRPQRTSVLFLLTQGYAVLDNPRLPIIGEGEVEPNDTYVEQLVAGAEAAVDYIVRRGIADAQRIGIGGHSYGGFTTVNLLAHTNLFALGIARSGAYNRTLTPFGFQGEQRNFWEATETYIKMSPFTQINKVKAPLLLIHGEKDSNPGTYPVQTERLYEALKGLGGTVRYVVLPLEDHGYGSREAVGHVLWEMVTWCDRYLKAT